jgi:hypothetical protein
MRAAEISPGPPPVTGYQRMLLSLSLRCGLAMGNFLDELMGGSFFAEAIERRDSRSVAFQGLIAVRAAFVEETEPSGL